MKSFHTFITERDRKDYDLYVATVVAEAELSKGLAVEAKEPEPVIIEQAPVEKVEPIVEAAATIEPTSDLRNLEINFYGTQLAAQVDSASQESIISINPSHISTSMVKIEADDSVYAFPITDDHVMVGGVSFRVVEGTEQKMILCEKDVDDLKS